MYYCHFFYKMAAVGPWKQNKIFWKSSAVIFDDLIFILKSRIVVGLIVKENTKTLQKLVVYLHPHSFTLFNFFSLLSLSSSSNVHFSKSIYLFPFGFYSNFVYLVFQLRSYFISSFLCEVFTYVYFMPICMYFCLNVPNFRFFIIFCVVFFSFSFFEYFHFRH